MTKGGSDNVHFSHRHLLGIEGLSPEEISILLDRSETYVEQNRRADKTTPLLHGRTIINLLCRIFVRCWLWFRLSHLAIFLSALVANRPDNVVRFRIF